MRIAIELKHLTRGLTVDVEGEWFTLSSQSAHDIARYDVVKDIERVEELVDAGFADHGYVIVLSNDQAYWRRGTKANPIDLRFRLREGARLAGLAAWSDAAGAGTTRSRDRPIELAGEYVMAWDDFSRVADGPAGRYRYLLIEVPTGMPVSETSPDHDSAAVGTSEERVDVTTTSEPTARVQILNAFAALEQRLGRSDFALREVVEEARRRGTSLAESTIRTFVTSVMCVDAPADDAVRYADLRRVEHGRYERITRRSPAAPDRSLSEPVSDAG